MTLQQWRTVSGESGRRPVNRPDDILRMLCGEMTLNHVQRDLTHNDLYQGVGKVGRVRLAEFSLAGE